MSDRCPTCGQAVAVQTGSEGTSSYVKLAEAQLDEAREAIEVHRETIDEATRSGRWPKDRDDIDNDLYNLVGERPEP